MSCKKQKVDYNSIVAAKLWRENPPGQEQKELEKLFTQKLISDSHTPNSVRLMNPLFSEFSPKVFGVHFRKTKAKFGLFAQSSESSTSANSLPELGTDAGSNSENFPDSAKFDGKNIEFITPPYSTWMFTDHEKKCDFVYVAVPIFSGSKDINFNISEDGSKVSINYTWPTAIFKPFELFSDEINNKDDKKKISMNHPKIHSLTTQLLECGVTEHSRPRGNIIISLPVVVQREVGSWKKKAINTSDGSKIVLLEFKGFQKNKIIEDADTTIFFE